MILHYWRPALEILILWFVIYHVLLFFVGTRAIHVLRGLIIIILIFFLAQKLNLEVVGWLFGKMFAISVIALLIIFSPEIRQGLARLGQRHLFSLPLREEEMDFVLKEIVSAAEILSREKIGAIIAIEKNDPLKSYIENGVKIDGLVSADLLQAIFAPKGLLHDGAVIIQQGRLMAAGCLFPLTQNQDINRMFGTRHRAALGLSEETDALIVIVSEERQDISLVYRGKLYKDLSRENIFSSMKEILKKNE